MSIPENTRPLKTFIVACSWTECGEFKVEAETLEDAIAKVEAGEKPYDGLPPNSEYVDDSFEVNKEVSEELSNQQ